MEIISLKNPEEWKGWYKSAVDKGWLDLEKENLGGDNYGTVLLKEFVGPAKRKATDVRTSFSNASGMKIIDGRICMVKNRFNCA